MTAINHRRMTAELFHLFDRGMKCGVISLCHFNCMINIHSSPKESYIFSIDFSWWPKVRVSDFLSFLELGMLLGRACKNPHWKMCISQGQWPRGTRANGEIKCNFLLVKSVHGVLQVINYQWKIYHQSNQAWESPEFHVFERKVSRNNRVGASNVWPLGTAS